MFATYFVCWWQIWRFLFIKEEPILTLSQQLRLNCLFCYEFVRVSNPKRNHPDFFSHLLQEFLPWIKPFHGFVPRWYFNPFTNLFHFSSPQRHISSPIVTLTVFRVWITLFLFNHYKHLKIFISHPIPFSNHTWN